MNLNEKLKTLPQQAGVYLMKDNFNNVIYVGKAKNLKKRVNQYFDNRPNKEYKTIALVQKIKDFDFIITESEIDAFILENTLIKKYQPHYNILLKDAKTFPYIKIDMSKSFPKIEITRKILKDNSKYFGPYLNGISAKDILNIASYAFQLRTCNKSLKKLEKRECLNFFLGKCTAPCTNKITSKEYKLLVNDVIEFLKGNTKKVQNFLENKMKLAGEMEQFERAIELRDLLNKLHNINKQITTEFLSNINADIFGIFSYNQSSCVSTLYIRNGKLMGCNNTIIFNCYEENILTSFFTQIYSENQNIPSKIYVPEKVDEVISSFLSQKMGHKIEIIFAQKGKFKKLTDNANKNAREYLEKNLQIEKIKQERTTGALEKLKQKLGLINFPQRIECYDISHISGTNQVASMVVFENGESKKSDYRKFKIKWVEGNNDFECLKEVITRRMNELNKATDSSFSKKPDLMVIDGGKGQLSGVSKILREYNNNIDLISLAKREEEIFVENQTQSIKLLKSEYSLQLLIRLRDEAHRFAITFHRQRRNKSMLLK